MRFKISFAQHKYETYGQWMRCLRAVNRQCILCVLNNWCEMCIVYVDVRISNDCYLCLSLTIFLVRSMHFTLVLYAIGKVSLTYRTFKGNYMKINKKNTLHKTSMWFVCLFQKFVDFIRNFCVFLVSFFIWMHFMAFYAWAMYLSVFSKYFSKLTGFDCISNVAQMCNVLCMRMCKNIDSNK